MIYKEKKEENYEQTKKRTYVVLTPNTDKFIPDKLGQLSSDFQCHPKGCLPCLLCFQQNIVCLIRAGTVHFAPGLCLKHCLSLFYVATTFV